METMIHPTAIIEKGAEIDSDVEIGPYSVIGANVKIAKNTKISSHVIVEGHTSIGESNSIGSFSTIGLAPQDFSYKGEPTKTIIGNGNTIREYVSIHRGTLKDNGVTQIGNDGLFMAYVHFGHDVQVGDNVVIANSSNCAGHVKIGSRVIIGGVTSIGQFVAIGEGAYIGGNSSIDKDIPCYCTAYGNRVRLKGINIIGLKRRGEPRESISELVEFYRTMEVSSLSPRSFVNNEKLMSEYHQNKLVEDVANFINKSDMGLPLFMS